ncbi:hypothetical protein EEL31_18050 [Brevibacillus laterosporus]|uniref:Uncharacterized protein n=1 Tax=Brevibacillus laterosporus TaxID=1465 RepID=A0A518V4B5_BRELA|nr:hypothetical protein [Brevibacillus laterosporus]QDX91833.1 hypothetical protein EEL30_05290 [Brevibacillus laterosporus]TPG70203.1 hypothetical protein EEL31_18050 [Brevibacillus laterosporus]
MNLKSFLKSGVIVTFLLTSVVPTTFAEESTSIQITNYEQSPINYDATVQFTDPQLAGTAKPTTQGGVSTQGVIREEYSHSYYNFGSAKITDYNLDKRTADTFLISVARGQTVTLGKTVTVSGSIEFNTSVSTEIKKVISLGFDLKANGSYSDSFSSSTTFTGPSESSSKLHRDFYGAIGYDKYTVKLKKYDVYKVYNGNAYMRDETYSAGDITVSSVDRPKKISYSKDF